MRDGLLQEAVYDEFAEEIGLQSIIADKSANFGNKILPHGQERLVFDESWITIHKQIISIKTKSNLFKSICCSYRGIFLYKLHHDWQST